MKLKTIVLYLFIINFLGLAIHATAETPKEKLIKLFADLKSSKDVSPLVEIVDWKNNFSSLDEDLKAQMKIKSPEDLKNNYLKMAISNGQFLIDQVNSRKDFSGNARENIVNNSLSTSKLQKRLKQIQEKNAKILRQTKYEILNVTDSGDKAKIKLKKAFKDQKSEFEIELKLVDGSWVMSNAGSLNPIGSGQTFIGILPDPLSGLILE